MKFLIFVISMLATCGSISFAEECHVYAKVYVPNGPAFHHYFPADFDEIYATTNAEECFNLAVRAAESVKYYQAQPTEYRSHGVTGIQECDGYPIFYWNYEDSHIFDSQGIVNSRTRIFLRGKYVTGDVTFDQNGAQLIR